MSTKLSLLSRAAAVVITAAFAVPALAEGNSPAATPAAPAASAAKQTSGDVDHKGEKKLHAKKVDKEHKQIANKTMPPAGTAKTETGSNK
jgi:Skp family chaperone for outer membrane proteins